MENKSSQNPAKPVLNLKELPPIDPLRIMNSSSFPNSKGKLNNFSTRAPAKVIKPSPKQEETKPVDKSENCGKTNSQTETHSSDHGEKKGSARSNLYEICAANHWKSPIFECYKEEGPSHQRMFTFKVIIETQAELKNIIECYGAPCQKKKTAADEAAEGALWYLKHIGYVMKNQ